MRRCGSVYWVARRCPSSDSQPLSRDKHCQHCSAYALHYVALQCYIAKCYGRYVSMHCIVQRDEHQLYCTTLYHHVLIWFEIVLHCDKREHARRGDPVASWTACNTRFTWICSHCPFVAFMSCFCQHTCPACISIIISPRGFAHASIVDLSRLCLGFASII